MEGGTTEAHRRFDITLENANAFWRATRVMSNRFTPLGVIQGWSPGSMAEDARRLVALGYNYLAVGGTVPLKSPQIQACLRALLHVVPGPTRLHILGFATADVTATFRPFAVTRFGTTTSLILACQDTTGN